MSVVALTSWICPECGIDVSAEVRAARDEQKTAVIETLSLPQKTKWVPDVWAKCRNGHFNKYDCSAPSRRAR